MACWNAAREEQQTIWQRLAPLGKQQSFARNTIIYTPDDDASTLYLLCSGQVNIYLMSGEGRILTLQVAEEGGFFGHIALAGSPTYDTFAAAISATRAIAIPREHVLAALSEHPPLGSELIQELGCYLLTISTRLDELAFKSVPSRLASVLLNMANPTTSEQQVRLPRRTHQQLAEMTNAYRETVTKIIGQFRADHLLDVDRSGIILLNAARLRELAQNDRGMNEG